MSTRRGKGEHSLYYNEGRERWELTIELPPHPDGRRHRQTKTSKKKKVLVDYLKDLNTSTAVGLSTEATTMTVGQLLERYDHSVVPGKGVAKTIEGWRDSIRHLDRELGPIKLMDLRLDHIDGMMARLVAGSLRSINAQKKLLAHLKHILSWAQDRDFVLRNVATNAKYHHNATPVRKGKPFTADELPAFIEAAASHRLAALWKTGVALGLRPGELCGLLSSDLDLEHGIVHVNRSLKWDEDGRVIGLGEVKTGSGSRGERSLGMAPPLVQALQEHMDRLAQERLAYGSTWPAQWKDLVFVSGAGTPLEERNLRRQFNTLVEQAGLAHRVPYDMRKTFATQADRSGVSESVIKDMLGHERGAAADAPDLARSVYISRNTAPIMAAAGISQTILGS